MEIFSHILLFVLGGFVGFLFTHLRHASIAKGQLLSKVVRLQDKQGKLEEIVDLYKQENLTLHQQHRQIVKLVKNKHIQLGNWERALILITEVTAQTLNAARVGIWQYDSLTEQMTCVNLYERKRDKHQAGLVLSRKNYPVYFESLLGEEILVVSDTYQHPATAEFIPSYLPVHGVKATLVIPYFVNTKFSGIITCEDRTERDWTIQEIQYAQSMAYVIAVAYKASKRKEAEKEIIKQKEAVEQSHQQLAKQNEEIQLQRDLLANQQSEIIEKSGEITQMNAQLKSLNVHLEKQVQERTESLVEANKELETAYQELDMFTYRASHDFRGPITTLLGLVQIGQIENRNPSVHNLFEKIKLTTHKMDNMLGKLLMVHDINYRPPRLTRIEINALVEEVQNALLSFIREYNVELRLTEDSAPSLFSDYGLMNIVLYNLTENAIFFRSQDRPLKISVQLKNHQNHSELIVSDNGAGIPIKVRQHIFDMFYRGAVSSGGNGLGLYVVKKALEKLKGSVQVESQPDTFTTFYIQIPKPVNPDVPKDAP